MSEDSVFHEIELMEILGDSYSPIILKKLRDMEDAVRNQIVILTEKLDSGEIAHADYAFTVNRLLDEQKHSMASILGEDGVTRISGVEFDTDFKLIDPEEAAKADSQIRRSRERFASVALGFEIEEVQEALAFYDCFRTTGMKVYSSRTSLLNGITEVATEEFLVGEENQIWFVLNESADDQDPYFHFVEGLSDIGYKINYATESDDVVSRIKRLQEKFEKTKGLTTLEVREKIDMAKLSKAPRVSNLCFLKVSEKPVIGFATFRGDGGTMAGHRLSEKQSREEYEDMLTNIADTESRANLEVVHSAS